MRAQSAIAEAGMQGQITLKRTNHGESRLPNIEKFDLGDGYRLVVQVVDPGNQERAFLFVGDHEDAERWLDNHKDYKWVQKKKDKTLEFVQVTVPDAVPLQIPKFDLESPESLRDVPLLRNVTEEEWKDAGIQGSLKKYLLTVTSETWEQDPNGVLSHVEENSGTEIACLVTDLFEHAHNREWDEVHRRLEVWNGGASIVKDAEAYEAMIDSQNSERFVTWTDLAKLPADSDWSDWMLFLHPEQKEFVEKSYNGPTRLRGVSGSGKTCVMIHRARHLAKKYKEKVLLVTLTESMRKLLDLLVKQLCHHELDFIQTSTMTSLTRDLLTSLQDWGFTSTGDNQREGLLNAAIFEIRSHPDYCNSVLSKLDQNDRLRDFIDDEIQFIRTRFLPSEYQSYLEVKRHGRKIPLPEKMRKILLAAAECWDGELVKTRTGDFERISQRTLKAVVEEGGTFDEMPWDDGQCWRSVLVDEVQDLSQIEMRILSNLRTPKGERVVDVQDGMFLVGDGAQKIYQRGFSFKACGIPIANRSFVLQKNYRNSREILEAAFGLIKSYEFADVDEENVQLPTQPHLSSRHGDKPWIVKCATPEDECDFIVSRIQEMLEERDFDDEAEEYETQSDLPIGIIGFNPVDRERIKSALMAKKVSVSELRDDVTWNTNAVKVSTLESAKGHEFHAVFIMGVRQGTMPHYRVPEADWQNEAARLYVGMTRARDYLYLSYDISRDNPSRFLSSIVENCTEMSFRKGELHPVE